jgi:hypothetical protein
MAGTAATGGQRRGHPIKRGSKGFRGKSGYRRRQWHIGPWGESPPLTDVSDPGCAILLVTAGEARLILGMGPGSGVLHTRAAKAHGRPVGKPLSHPVGCAVAARTVAINRRYEHPVPWVARAEGAEAGPGREQTCHKNRLDAGQGPRGEFATHPVGLLVLWGRACRRREQARLFVSDLRAGESQIVMNGGGGAAQRGRRAWRRR